MIYLSGCASPSIRRAAATYPIGVLCTPSKGYMSQIGAFRWWAADNACFTQGDRFDLTRYLAWLARYCPHIRSCLFATAPDVVGDAVATWRRSAKVLPQLRALGFPAALVAQDGIERTRIRWGAFDVLFIGGSTEWKLGEAANAIASEAKARGKWVHMGRVNSGVRMRKAWAWECDSVDGTQLKRPDKYLARLKRQLAEVNWQAELWSIA